MEKIVRMLQKPVKHFTVNGQLHHAVQEYSVCGQSPFFWEDDCVIIYVKAGTGFLRANQTVYRLEPGSLCVLHQYHVFRFESEGAGTLKLQVLVYPYYQMAYLTIENHPGDEVFAEHPVVVFSDAAVKSKIELLFNAYSQESEKSDSLRDPILLSLLEQLRCMFTYAHQVPPLFPVPLCSQLFQYIGTHSLTPLSIEDVAKQFGLSEARVNHELRRICLESFKAVLSHAQVCNACTFLLRTNTSGTMLAASSGFTSEGALYRNFYKWRGMTPRQYRQQICDNSSIVIWGINDQLMEIQVYVYEHFQEEITAETCAQKLYLTVPVIGRLLSEHYGPDVTFHGFLQSVRLQYAEGLLTASDLPIGDIALESGFNSIHTFNRLFKRKHQMPPSQFRKQGKGSVNDQ